MEKKSDLDATIQRISDNKGTIGVIITNEDGAAIRTTLDHPTTVQYSDMMRKMAVSTQNAVREINPEDDLRFLRIRTKKHEVMVAPDNGYMMIAIHDPSVDK